MGERARGGPEEGRGCNSADRSANLKRGAFFHEEAEVEKVTN